MSQSFGGDWTQEKLARVGKYLNAYTHILSKKNFRFAYIDAFAGTGYNEIKDDDDQNQPMFQELRW